RWPSSPCRAIGSGSDPQVSDADTLGPSTFLLGARQEVQGPPTIPGCGVCSSALQKATPLVSRYAWRITVDRARMTRREERGEKGPWVDAKPPHVGADSLGRLVDEAANSTAALESLHGGDAEAKHRCGLLRRDARCPTCVVQHLASVAMLPFSEPSHCP